MRISRSFFSLLVLPIVIIDPGHGGKDPGAIGIHRIREKEVVLAIAKKVARRLEGKATILFTRSNDRFVSLAQRNRIANKNACNFFLSIHANANRHHSPHGLEIYTLNNSTDAASKRLARRENEGAPKKEKELAAIVSQLILNEAADESAEAAQHLKKTIGKRLGLQPGIKTALFYVLVGAKCPSLLVETGFVTNPAEAKRLKNRRYQEKMAQAISDGILAYFKEAAVPKGDL